MNHFTICIFHFLFFHFFHLISLKLNFLDDSTLTTVCMSVTELAALLARSLAQSLPPSLSLWKFPLLLPLVVLPHAHAHLPLQQNCPRYCCIRPLQASLSFTLAVPPCPSISLMFSAIRWFVPRFQSHAFMGVRAECAVLARLCAL